MLGHTKEQNVNETFSHISKNMPLNDTRNTTGNADHLHTADTIFLFQGDYDFTNY